LGVKTREPEVEAYIYTALTELDNTVVKWLRLS
jgi:hypothetical protein